MIATVNVGNEKSRAKMKKWFEKWSAEKARRKEKNLPAIVDYRDETYVSGSGMGIADGSGEKFCIISTHLYCSH